MRPPAPRRASVDRLSTAEWVRIPLAVAMLGRYGSGAFDPPGRSDHLSRHAERQRGADDGAATGGAGPRQRAVGSLDAV
jgi:hypothetical protein